jgi:tetratricopeptide (TPR) repeat protein
MGHCLYDLAKLSMAQARYEQAEPFFQQALQIVEKRLDENLLEAAAFLEHYAALLLATKREDEAAKLLEQASKIRAKHAQRSGDVEHIINGC